jgi:drug/metabolite transporter (DMT)-like permease
MHNQYIAYSNCSFFNFFYCILYLAMFSRVFLGEQFGVQGYIGTALVLLAVWYSSSASRDSSDENVDKT